MRATQQGKAIKAFPRLLLLTTITLLGACEKQAPVEAGKPSPPAVAAQATPAGAMGDSLNAQQFLSRASKTTKQNPIKPDWPFVSIEGSNLNLMAHPVEAQLETLVQTPLAGGAYELKTSAMLSPTSEFPIEFAIDLIQNGKPARLLSRTFKPNETVDMVQAIQVPAGAPCELALVVKMVSAAKNNYGATLYLRDFMLSKRP